MPSPQVNSRVLKLPSAVTTKVTGCPARQEHGIPKPSHWQLAGPPSWTVNEVIVGATGEAGLVTSTDADSGPATSNPLAPHPRLRIASRT